MIHGGCRVSAAVGKLYSLKNKTKASQDGAARHDTDRLDLLQQDLHSAAITLRWLEDGS
jgi:hypothetical protein